MSPSHLPTDCKLGRKTPVSRPATASQSRPAPGRRSTKNVLNKQNKVHYYKEKTAGDGAGGDQSSKIRSGGEGPRRARSFLRRREPERGGRSPLRAARGGQDARCPGSRRRTVPPQRGTGDRGRARGGRVLTPLLFSFSLYLILFSRIRKHVYLEFTEVFLFISQMTRCFSLKHVNESS